MMYRYWQHLKERKHPYWHLMTRVPVKMGWSGEKEMMKMLTVPWVASRTKCHLNCIRYQMEVVSNCREIWGKFAQKMPHQTAKRKRKMMPMPKMSEYPGRIERLLDDALCGQILPCHLIAIWELNWAKKTVDEFGSEKKLEVECLNVAREEVRERRRMKRSNLVQNWKLKRDLLLSRRRSSFLERNFGNNAMVTLQRGLPLTGKLIPW